jgi:alpha-L-rhamnosidase
MKLTFALLALAAALSAPALAAPARLTPQALKCEYLTRPLGIEERSPRPYWQLASSQRAQRQSAYQVLVASTEALLNREQGDLWDSGKVMSSASVHIPYRGKPVASRQRCYWRVRVWDQDGRPSSYSPAEWWEMGLLEPADWKADWIGLPSTARREAGLTGERWVWFPEGNPVQGAPACRLPSLQTRSQSCSFHSAPARKRSWSRAEQS